MCQEMNIKALAIVVLMPLIVSITHHHSFCDGFKTDCFVEDGTGTDPTDNCILPMIKCHSFNDLPSVLNENSYNTQVMFCSTLFTLNLHLELQGLQNISFIGNPSIFSCSDNAGLTIINSVDISITNITFEHCGVLHNSTSVDIANNYSLLLFRSAVYILNSTDIILESVTISRTNGLGLAFIDTDGSINVTNCTFTNNSVNENETEVIAGGGGVYIEFTYCLPSQYSVGECYRRHHTNNSKYQFDECNFADNVATSINRKQTDFSISEKGIFQGLGRGGGLNVVFRGAATQNTIMLNNCQFVNNSAIWGGGLKVIFLDQVSRNTFIASECVFENNLCASLAGGGADVGFSYISQPFPQKNIIRFFNCKFTKNVAKFGGGLALYSSSGAHENLSNIIEFERCIWTHNKASYGSAVDISTHAWATVGSGYLPSPRFKDSVFFENYIIYKRREQEIFSFYKKGNAAFLVTEFTIGFFGTVNFTNNNGSALVLVSSVVNFETYTNVVFHNNLGFNGGAIALLGYSVLIFNDNIAIILSNNKAIRCGGAIYSHSIDKHEYVSSRTCLFHNDKVFNNQKWVNSSIKFVNNEAGTLATKTSVYCGHSISATTLLPCSSACKTSAEKDKVNLEDAFMCFANFIFSNSSDRDYEVVTYGAQFTSVNKLEPLKMIPSKEESLPLELVDDLGQRVDSEIFLEIHQNGDPTVELDRSYSFLSDNRTVLYGQPGTTALLTLSTTTARENSVTLKLSIQRCPPGYIYEDNECVCSVGTKQFYNPVYACDNKEFVAIVRHGYWIGYVKGETEDDLLYSYCPSRRCFYNLRQNSTHKLTTYASKNELDKVVCGDNTTGVLCSSCKAGYTARYHTIGLVCSNDSCKYGWLFYIVSELLPITALFLIVIVLNISFVTGELNGFIFFAQMIYSVSISAQGFIRLPKIPYLAIRIARLFYLFFNIDFFRLNELSFCLWTNAKSLDVLAFKYLTVAYALLLIAITIWLMNKCNLYKRIYCLRASTMRSSITHGLSAFLVMVYAQCATISLKILGFTYLYTKGHKYKQTIVQYQGDMLYFHSQHLPYAILALICLIFVVVLPAAILLLYPSCFRVVSLLHLGDKKCISWMLQRIPHAYLKPFADSFQSCFKDNLRFFAGLYFVYRLALLSAWLMSSLLTQRLMLVQLLFTSMLLVHSICQPYKKRLHNTLDAFIFFILSVINGITVYNYSYTTLDITDKTGTNALVHVQAVLVYLPLVYFVIFTAASSAKKLRNLHKFKTLSMSIQLNWLTRKSRSDDDLPNRMEESDRSSVDYQDYNDHSPI